MYNDSSYFSKFYNWNNTKYTYMYCMYYNQLIIIIMSKIPHCHNNWIMTDVVIPKSDVIIYFAIIIIMTTIQLESENKKD